MALQDQLTSWNNMCLAYQNASRGKRGRAATAAFDLYLADNLLTLQSELEQRTYLPGKYHSFHIHEPKQRLISAAPFRDRVVHHALCNITTPYLESQFIDKTYANRVGKGTHRAIDQCQKFSRRYRYVLQCDVVQFFPSIDLGILKEILFKMLPDGSVNWLVERILTSGQDVLSEEYRMVYFPGDDLFASLRPRGLPIGNLTSQWWANAYLNPFDQFVTRELGCRGYLRYVDDFLLFSDDKIQLWQWREAIIRRLEQFRVTIHLASALPRPVTDGVPFLGFVIYPTHRLLKRRKGIAYRRKLNNLQKVASQAAIKASVQGWTNHLMYADTYGLRKSVLSEMGLLVGNNYV
jgi:RNA-directed DNA polymerase